jgi:hypothetical protein
MDKDIKLQLAIAKMEGSACLAIDIDSIHCPEGEIPCGRCPYHNFIIFPVT